MHIRNAPGLKAHGSWKENVLYNLENSAFSITPFFTKNKKNGATQRYWFYKYCKLLGRDSALDETHIINGWSINGINHLSNFGHIIYYNMGHRRHQWLLLRQIEWRMWPVTLHHVIENQGSTPFGPWLWQEQHRPSHVKVDEMAMSIESCTYGKYFNVVPVMAQYHLPVEP